MTLKKQPLQIPFNTKTGSVDHYAVTGHQYTDIIFKDNYTFLETLHYKGYSRGRSSALIQLADSVGTVYNLFMSTFDELMRMTNRHQYSFTYGSVFTGRWTFCKKGSNYALRPCTDQETTDHDDAVSAANIAAFKAAKKRPAIDPWNLKTDSNRE